MSGEPTSTMGLLGLRELLQFPRGDNTSDVYLHGAHFSRKTLNRFSYSFWANGTLSNESECWVVIDDVISKKLPTLQNNGTFINATSCYDPYFSMGERSILGITTSGLFLLSLVFTLVNVRKHGRLFLPSEKRFRAIGRRWQWYWLIVVATCGAISGFTGLDVDRDLPSMSLILQSFFYFLMIPALLAAVWESVRHWGSWQERQIIDRDAFSLPPGGSRDRKEFWMPLIFYLFAFMVRTLLIAGRFLDRVLTTIQNFFMAIPRSWAAVDEQTSPEQTAVGARPAATDSRFKAAALFALLAWCVTCYNLHHSLHHYRRMNRGPIRRVGGMIRDIPIKFLLMLPLTLVVIAYAAASSVVFDVNLIKFDVNDGWMYGLGHLPILLILAVFEVFGHLDENEDRVLLRQRRDRGRGIDAELGVQRKPEWWNKRHAEAYMSPDKRLKALTQEVGGDSATQRNVDGPPKMEEFPANDPPRKCSPNDVRSQESKGPVDSHLESQLRQLDDNASSITATTETQATRIQSMLEV